jgi:hypothetical protein
MRRVITLGLVLLTGSTSGRAATYDVPGDFGSLLAAADAAAPGDSILLAPGTYTERETRQVGSRTARANAFVQPGVVILGTGGADVTIVIGDPPEPAITNGLIVTATGNPSEEPVELIGLTMRGGQPDLVAVSSRPSGESSFRVVDCIVEQCRNGIDRTGTGTLFVERTTFRGNPGIGPSSDPVIRGRNGAGIFIRDSRFEDNENPLIDAYQESSLLIEGTVFIRNDGNPLVDAGNVDSVLVRGCRFENNGVLFDGIVVSGGNSLVEGNVFAFNRSDGDQVLRLEFGNHELRSNTFFGNEVEPTTSVVRIRRYINGSPFEVRVTSNVFANTLGGSALSGGVDSIACNVFWENARPVEFYPAASFFELDPKLCDPTAGDFTVEASSPCLAENNPGCGLIGALGLGCPSTPPIPHAILTDPPGLPVEVDGIPDISPHLVAWEPGSLHTIGCQASQQGGRSDSSSIRGATGESSSMRWSRPRATRSSPRRCGRSIAYRCTWRARGPRFRTAKCGTRQANLCPWRPFRATGTSSWIGPESERATTPVRTIRPWPSSTARSPRRPDSASTPGSCRHPWSATEPSIRPEGPTRRSRR